MFPKLCADTDIIGSFLTTEKLDLRNRDLNRATGPPDDMSVALPLSYYGGQVAPWAITYIPLFSGNYYNLFTLLYNLIITSRIIFTTLGTRYIRTFI